MSYHSEWRAAHPEYRKREAERKRRRRQEHGRESRATEYRNRPSRAVPKVTPLFPALVRGVRLSFWNDELRMDLEQEHALARLEGRSPADAVRRYRAIEVAWQRLTVPLVTA